MIDLVTLYDDAGLGPRLRDWLSAQGRACRCQAAEIHAFPDGEIRVRIPEPVGEDVVLVCSLDHPSEKTLALTFVSDVLRGMGARRLRLVIPYLAYMRQDIAFHPGEGVSAASYARLLSRLGDALVTVDPHLHRIPRLEDVYSLPATALHATGILGDWLKERLDGPSLLIGPDRESEQWVTAVAARCAQPFLVLDKERLGDRQVEIRVPDLRDRGPLSVVLVDDMVSTGHTLMKVATQLRRQGLTDIRAVFVHALFGEDTTREMRASGIHELASCNTVAHVTNRIDITPLLGEWLIDRTA